MISKSKINLIRNLKDKKTRKNTFLFLVEGERSILELLCSDFDISDIFISKKFYEKNFSLLKNKPFEIVEEFQIIKNSFMENNPFGIAIVKQKENLLLENNGNGFILVLDEIKDPGNLGTIIRICDWYGIKKIICPNSSVDFYNPKTINSTMGSFVRVLVFYTDLEKYFKEKKHPVYGTFLGGDSIYDFEFGNSGFIIVGNESHGISKNLEFFLDKKITIPKFGEAESLNVGVATGIIIDNLKRNLIKK